MMDWATDNMWIWSTNDVDAGSNRIEVQVRDGKHAGPSGLDDVRSAGFTLNTHATTVEPGVFKQVSKVHQEPASSPKPVDLITAKVTLTLHVREGSSSGPIIPGAQVIVQDGSGNMFHETADNNGVVTIKGDPGTWSFTTSAEGYETNSWSQQMIDTSAKDAFLQKMQGHSSAYSKANQLSESKSADYTSKLNSNMWDTKWAAKGSGKMGRPAYNP
jgi:hypothetical protein